MVARLQMYSFMIFFPFDFVIEFENELDEKKKEFLNRTHFKIKTKKIFYVCELIRSDSNSNWKRKKKIKENIKEKKRNAAGELSRRSPPIDWVSLLLFISFSLSFSLSLHKTVHTIWINFYFQFQRMGERNREQSLDVRLKIIWTKYTKKTFVVAFGCFWFSSINHIACLDARINSKSSPHSWQHCELNFSLLNMSSSIGHTSAHIRDTVA